MIVACVALVACGRDAQAVRARALERAEAYRTAGKLREAVVELRNAVQADPRAGEARLKLAEALLELGDLAGGLEEYVRAADLLPDRVDVQLRAGELLLLAGRFDDARVRAERALGRDPKNVDAHILLANALAGLKNPEAAIEEIEEALALDPARPAAYASLGAIEAGRGRLDAAEQAFRRTVELSPSSAPAHLALANFYWAAGRLDEARRAIARGLTLAPEDVMVRRAAASFALATGHADEAEGHLKKIRELTKSAASTLMLADFYVSQRKPEPARALLETLTGTASAAEAEVRLAALDHAAGRVKEAYARVDKVLAREPRHLRALLVRSALLLEDGRREEALASAEQAVQAHPDVAAAHHMLGRVQVARRRTEPAIAAFETVLRLNPRATAARVALANLQLAAGRTDVSLGHAQDALQREPGNPDARLALVRGLMARGDLAEAEKELAQLAKEFPRSSAVLIQQGILQGRRKDAAGARRLFEQALALEPAATEAVAGLVALDIAAKQPEAARRRVDEYIGRPGATIEAQMLAARTYFAIGDRRAAEAMLRRVTERDPSYLPAYNALVQLYAAERRLDEALAEAEALAARDPKPVAALTVAGVILQMRGRTDEARDRYERAVQLDPAAAVASNNLAWIYARSGGNLDVALQLAQAAHRQLPESAEVNDTLGYIYYRKDLLPQAIQALRVAVEKDPRQAGYQYRLGLALAKAGDTAAAASHLRRALELKPDMPEAAEARALLQSLGAK
ncbi:MAG TPA: tetratricopeptide repeat protein [Vicinamibacterales bacterium]|nr:tetratricopeptide repeat protein [Vicinamibacterales bacterium]